MTVVKPTEDDWMQQMNAMNHVSIKQCMFSKKPVF